LAVGTFLINY
jgi:intracellular protein transport protein USO1